MRIVSKRRLASTTIGVILSVAIIFSIFTLGNNIAKADLYDTLESSNAHITIVADIETEKYSEIVNEIRGIPHVESADCFLMNPITINTSYGMTIENMGYFDKMRKVTHLQEGNFPEEKNEVAISEELVGEYGIHPGDVIHGVTTNETGAQVNLTLHVVGIFSSYPRDSIWGMIEILTPLETLEFNRYTTMYGGVKVDVNYLMSSPDMNDINRKLSIIAGEIENVIRPYSDYVKVSSTISYYPNVLYSVMFLGFSLPIIAMGAYLSKVGIEIELTERRREFGIMRIRGASNFQRFKLLLYESIAYSIIGGIGGYLLGEAMAYLANETIMGLPYFAMDLGWEYALAAVITSLFLFFIALYKPWKKISSLPMVELISHYTQSFKSVEYSPIKDIVKTAFLWAYILSGIYVFQNVSFNGGFNIFVLIAVIILFTMGFLFPLILIFLPLYMTRILTLGTQRIYVYLASALAKVSGVAGELVKKGVSRNPKNIAYIAFILAFILTFSTFISAMYDNTLLADEIRDVQRVGGDFRIMGSSYVSPAYFSNSKNVSSLVAIHEDFSASVYNEPVVTLYCDFGNYTRTVYLLDLFTKEGSFQKGGVVINDALAKRYNLHAGDNVQIHIPGEGYRNYRISAVVYSFPGNGEGESQPVVMMDREPDVGNVSYIILRAKNYDALKRELDEKGFNYEERNPEKKDYTSAFLSVIDAFMVLLGGATILIIQYSLYFNRRGEIALYKIRGATKRQVSAILMVEGSTVVILSVVVGVSIGLSLAYAFIVMMYSTSNLPVFFVLGRNFALVSAVMVLTFLAMQYIISAVFARVKQSEVIRSLGGEM